MKMKFKDEILEDQRNRTLNLLRKRLLVQKASGIENLQMIQVFRADLKEYSLSPGQFRDIAVMLEDEGQIESKYLFDSYGWNDAFVEYQAGERDEEPSCFDIKLLKDLDEVADSGVVPSDETINDIILVVSERHIEHIVINQNYLDTVKPRSGKYWSLFRDIAEGKRISFEVAGKGFIDYFCSDFRNPIFRQTGSVQALLNRERGYIVLNVPLKIIGVPEFRKRLKRG